MLTTLMIGSNLIFFHPSISVADDDPARIEIRNIPTQPLYLKILKDLKEDASKRLSSTHNPGLQYALFSTAKHLHAHGTAIRINYIFRKNPELSDNDLIKAIFTLRGQDLGWERTSNIDDGDSIMKEYMISLSLAKKSNPSEYINNDFGYIDNNDNFKKPY